MLLIAFSPEMSAYSSQATSRVVPTTLHKTLYDWPELGIKAGEIYCVELGPVKLGDLICLMVCEREVLSILVHTKTDGTIYIRGRSNKVRKLLKGDYEIKGRALKPKPSIAHPPQLLIVQLQEGKGWGWTADKMGAIAPCLGWTEFSGWPPESVNDWIYRIHPDERESSVRRWQEGSQRKGVFSICHRILDRAGHYASIYNLAAPIVGPTGEIEGWTGVSQIV